MKVCHRFAVSFRIHLSHSILTIALDLRSQFFYFSNNFTDTMGEKGEKAHKTPKAAKRAREEEEEAPVEAPATVKVS